MLDSTAIRGSLDFLYHSMFPAYRFLYWRYKAYIDRLERSWVREYLTQGSVVVDVGANVGAYSTFFAKLVGPTGHVVALEPDPDNFAHLLDLTRGFPTVQAMQAAAGAELGTVHLYRSKGFNFDHRTFKGVGDTDSVEVPMVRLDDALELGARTISLMKIDVQGSEMDVLRGAESVLDASPHAAVLVEYAPWGLDAAGSSPEEFIEYVRSREYGIYGFGGERGLLHDGIRQKNNRYWFRNLLLSRDENAVQLTELEWRQGEG